ncbi:hypothetical protein AB0N98_13110 [Streptomyces sp. NPDC093681]|uniref:hypothetical protein n=1 Tax=unclassified Streptomyces TaxID=2593676 RepID=UPI0013C8D976|nr:hypothetical protein [Streptomyces sp. SID10362]NDZ73466.1 hypothetical protein [Streptomyces sp. SID10362]
MRPIREMNEREYLACVGRRPGMFVGTGSSFHELTAFLTGYDQHALRHGGPGLTGWHEWLVARRGSSCSHAWPGQVLHIALPEGWDNIAGLPPEDENQAIKVLFQLLDEFAAEREASTDVQILG